MEATRRESDITVTLGHCGAMWGTVYAVSSLKRLCSRTACSRVAVATLTYVYADQTAVLGPLSVHAEPHSYDLCGEHACSLTVPRGWEVVRLVEDFGPEPTSADDVDALVEAVNRPASSSATSRESRPHVERGATGSGSGVNSPIPERRATLHVLRTDRPADPYGAKYSS